MWYLVKCFFKVLIDKINRFIVVCVTCFYDLGKEIEQACQAAPFISESMLRVMTYQVVNFQVLVCGVYLVSCTVEYWFKKLGLELNVQQERSNLVVYTAEGAQI